MPDVVVVGFIRSPEGEAALDAAIAETRRRSGRLVVVHSSPGGDHERAGAVVDDRLALEKIAETLAADGLEVLVENLARGNEPAEDLVEVAERHDAVLLVIGLRRRSPVGKLLMGSNAQTVLLLSDRPVLAVKAAAPQ